MSSWRVELLGGLRVRRDGAPCGRLRTRKAGNLLAFLALNPGRLHAREALADRFWPDAPPDAARHNVRTALSLLRQTFGDDFPLAADRLQVGLREGAIQTDVAELEPLLAAQGRAAPAERAALWERILTLYAGPLLPECYDDWAVARQRTVDETMVREARAFLNSLPGGDAHAWSLRLQIALPGRDELERDAAPVSAPSPSLPDTGALPTWLTRFVGRSEQREQLATLLAGDTRLVTLVGPGGVGKTRLACAVAARVPGTVRFVPLAPVTEPERIVDALRIALGLPPPGRETPPLEPIVAALHALPAPLLVLDNLEQLPGAAPTIAALLAGAPRLRCLVTSRAPLGVEGEQVVELSPLSRDDGLALFIDRARAVRLDFNPTEAEEKAVRALCRRLDNLPLALELAAAQVGVLAPAQLLGELKGRLDLTTRRTGDARHRSLRATIRWSYDLLAPDLQRLFRQLSVFHDGWALEEVREVLPAADLLGDLDTLRAHSLLQTRPVDGAMRFGLLETLRAFGDSLLADDERAQLEERHARCYAALADTLRHRSYWQCATAPENDRRIERERENLRAALEWATRTGETSVGLELAVGLWPTWYVRGEARDGRPWLERLLKMHPVETPEQARWAGYGYIALAALTQADGDVAAEEEAATRAVDLLRAFPDDTLTPWAFDSGALAALLRGDPDRSESLNREHHQLCEAADDRRGLALAWYRHAQIRMVRGEMDAARDEFETALAVCRPLEDAWMTALILYSLAGMACERLRWEEAERLMKESLALYQAAGSERGAAEVLMLRASAASDRGDSRALRALVDEGRERYPRLGWRWGLTSLELMTIWDALGRSDYAQALAGLSRARTLSRALNRAGALGACCYLEALLILRAERDPDRAAALLDEAERHQAQGGWLDAYLVRLGRAEVAGLRGDTAGAQAWLAAADERVPQGSMVAPSYAAWRARVAEALSVEFATARSGGAR